MAVGRWTLEEVGDFINHCEFHDLASRERNKRAVIEDLCTEGRHKKIRTLRMVPVVGRRNVALDEGGALPVGTSHFYEVVVDVPPWIPDDIVPLYIEEIIKPQLDEVWGEVPDWRGKIE